MDKELQRAHEEFRAIQKRKKEATGDARRLLDLIEKVDTGRYDIKTSEMLILRNIYRNSSLDFALAAFQYGFIKGLRAEKARQKKSHAQPQRSIVAFQD